MALITSAHQNPAMASDGLGSGYECQQQLPLAIAEVYPTILG
ncbi:hypothetical protein [Moorena producens]